MPLIKVVGHPHKWGTGWGQIRGQRPFGGHGGQNVISAFLAVASRGRVGWQNRLRQWKFLTELHTFHAMLAGKTMGSGPKWDFFHFRRSLCLWWEMGALLAVVAHSKNKFSLGRANFSCLWANRLENWYWSQSSNGLAGEASKNGKKALKFSFYHFSSCFK